MRSVWCKIVLPIAMGILKRVLPRLKQSAEQSKSSVDDLVIQAVEQVIEVYEEGEITRLLCG